MTLLWLLRFRERAYIVLEITKSIFKLKAEEPPELLLYENDAIILGNIPLLALVVVFYGCANEHVPALKNKSAACSHLEISRICMYHVRAGQPCGGPRILRPVFQVSLPGSMSVPYRQQTTTQQQQYL